MKIDDREKEKKKKEKSSFTVGIVPSGKTWSFSLASWTERRARTSEEMQDFMEGNRDGTGGRRQQVTSEVAPWTDGLMETGDDGESRRTGWRKLKRWRMVAW